ncbi:hypothetical protein SNE40_017728 [Patella caerulea]|uniref:C-type lectin domain-containing protein n=1 Tax=Patella caerulea TaxID=87958 RepID=A0AAN8JEU2_PATCE
MFSTQHIANSKLILLILIYFVNGYQCACYGGGVRCYTVHSGKVKYSQAQSGCQSGYGLVEITSPQIQTDLETELEGQTGDYYIGLTDTDLEGTFVWESGATLTWENWSASYQNNNGQDCVALSGSDGFKWTNKNCNQKTAYICSNNGKYVFILDISL